MCGTVWLLTRLRRTWCAKCLFSIKPFLPGAFCPGRLCLCVCVCVCVCVIASKLVVGSTVVEVSYLDQRCCGRYVSFRKDGCTVIKKRE